jgi:hypothetical protein
VLSLAQAQNFSEDAAKGRLLHRKTNFVTGSMLLFIEISLKEPSGNPIQNSLARLVPNLLGCKGLGAVSLSAFLKFSRNDRREFPKPV